jgi:hypothetical protein
MDRRYLLAAGAGGVGAAGAAALAAYHYGYIPRLPVVDPKPDHVIEVHNERDEAHEVTVSYDLGGEGMDHGPWRIKPGEIWTVQEFTDAGELTVRVTVDGERRLENSHEIPLLEDGSSAFIARLREGGFVTSTIQTDADSPA